MTSLSHGFATLLLEMLGVLAAVGMIWLAAAEGHPALPSVASGGLAAVAVAVALLGAQDAWSFIDSARHGAVSAQAGFDECFSETAAPAATVPFLHWLRLSLPADAHYFVVPEPQLEGNAPEIDPLCLALEMLPRLPVTSPQDAGWIVTFGTTPVYLKGLIARHDPTVHAFAPGYVAVRRSAP